MARPLLPALALIWGCGGAEPGEAARRAAITLAAARAPTDAGACAPLPDPEERGLCVGAAASALAQAGRGAEARAACGTLESGLWREECAFLVVDGLALAGAEAHSGCGEAGRFRAACLAHALAREAGAVLAAAQPGQEAQTLAALRAVVQHYPPGGARGDRAVALLAQHIQRRDQGQPFRAASCGALDAATCAQIYVARVQSEQREAERAAGCATGAAWLNADEASAPIVALARAALCPN